MPTYLISIGSNIDPHDNVPRILDLLLEVAPALRVSRILHTEPVGLRSDGGTPPGPFLNLAVALDWPGDEASLKARLIAIEEALGRDRAQSDRKRRSRTADLDLVAALGEVDGAVGLQLESYLRDAVLDLVPAAGDGGPAPTPEGGVPLSWGGREIGRRPVVLERSPSGHRIVVAGARPGAQPASLVGTRGRAR